MTFSRYLTLLIISLFSALVTSWGRIVTDIPQAGKAEVMGVLQMGKKALAVSDAHVMLVYLEDGERPDTLYRVSSKGGSFSFKGLPPGRVYIKATKVGMNDSDGVFDLTEGKNMVVFQMSYSSEYLEASSVVSNVPLMKILKDTTIFNAAAVKTFDGESALALLEQFPGFEVRGSSIKFMGKPNARTYVNGVQIFGDKAITAFNELYAHEVSQVRVYEETRAEVLTATAISTAICRADTSQGQTRSFTLKEFSAEPASRQTISGNSSSPGSTASNRCISRPCPITRKT